MLLKLAAYYLSLHYWSAASSASIKKMQVRKFKKLFENARRNSIFYREFYGDHGILDLKIESFDDIRRVPATNKALLKNYSIRNIMTHNMDEKTRVHSTSGSTGEPFKIAFSKFEDYSAHVRLTKALMENRYLPFKKIVLLSRYEPGHEFGIESDLKKIGWLQKKIGWFRYELISIFDPVETIIQKLEQIKPFVIWSTPSIIEIIALELKNTSRKLDIPLVLLMAENISPALLHLFRERIGKNFIDLYGCAESPSIGFGSNQSDVKKIFSNSTLVEVINKRQMGAIVIGDIIITNLINHSMPLIRYDLDDYAEVLDNDSFPARRIGKIFGRCEDVIHFGDHYILAFHQTYQLFSDFHECEQYKFVEKTPGKIVLQLKVNEKADKEKVKSMAMRRWAEKYPGYPLTIEWRKAFPMDKKTGKFKVIEKIGNPA